jgi:lipoate-protein ligase A
MPVELVYAFEGARTGAANMERDRAMLRAVERSPHPVVLLRVYGWDPPTLSLGFHQALDGVDLEAARARGIDVVRRPTGGGAVLHWNEWTYAIAGPLGLPQIGRRIPEIYAALGECLAAALRGLGIDARMAGEGRPGGFACFSGVGGHEIAVGGRKLVGSALRRGRRGFLQHGSILAGPEHVRLLELARAGALDAPTVPLPAPGAAACARERDLLARHTTDLRALGLADLTGGELVTRLAAELGARLGSAARAANSLDARLGP